MWVVLYIATYVARYYIMLACIASYSYMYAYYYECVHNYEVKFFIKVANAMLILDWLISSKHPFALHMTFALHMITSPHDHMHLGTKKHFHNTSTLHACIARL